MTSGARGPVSPAVAAAAFQSRTLSLARQWRRMRRNELARQVGVTATAISQYELGQVRPSAAVLARVALALSMPVEFFTATFPTPAMAGQAHFRSLRATSQAEREQAEAFGELARRVVEVIEGHLRLPDLRLPHLDLPDACTGADLQVAAILARGAFGLGQGPVAHMVRLLEANGLIVLTLPDVSDRVDAFSHWYGQRPYVFASASKNDKARSRMDAAHELAHLLLYRDAEPGSQILERQATAFASEFLAPTTVLRDELPARLDFDRLHELKHRWGISLKALVYRGHTMGIYREHTYRRGMNLLAEWGYPEPGDIGSRETPSLLGRAVDLLAGQQVSLDYLAAQTTLPAALVRAVVDAGSDPRPRLTVTTP